ncbi:HYR domain-containing protein [Flavobacterium sp. ZT3R18]|uniref:HYR domain-containing protein n=1 Tax=Flavobacterium sp. ZT3R18 TaxID=2594429 RepID=UPI00117B6DDF|nr:HYR domain-containing protein [Flavobacterium sp. ZT3R18]TRX33260.1 HYR domain-containing protein [Flavobacterium sp. ZT3R18]
MKTFLRNSRLLAIVFLIANLFLANISFGQTLTSDQSDYIPGTTATLTGSGFQAGELVTLIVLHADGTPATGTDHDPWIVTADINGDFVTTWFVCMDDCVGSTLIATADGQSSLLHAEVFFTDAAFTSRASGDWNNVDTWAAVARTGTITASTGSSTVTGVGTSFLTEIVPGDKIYNSAGTTLIGTVLSITNNTSLTLTGNASNAISGAAYSARKVPGLLDTVTIANGHTVTVTVAASCASLTYLSTATTNTFVNVNAGITLAVTGAITIPRASSNINTLAVGDGIVNAGSIAFTSSGTAVRHQVTITSGTVTVTGNIVGSGGNTSGTISFSGIGVLKIGGSLFVAGDGTLTTFAGSTVEYNGANQTVQDFLYSNLTTSGSLTKTLAGSTTVGGILTVRAGTTLALGGNTLGTPTSTVLECGAAAGSVITGTGILTLGGNVTVNNVAAGTSGATMASPVALGATRTFTVANDGTTATDLSISGIISGGGSGITKAGAGILTLSAVNTYTGATTITSGELRLNPTTNTTPNTQFVLNGGKLSTTGIALGRTITNASTLNLNANSSIDFGSNDHSLKFANSSGIGWAGTTLTINGWTGIGGSSGTGGKIFFGAANNTLTALQLAKITFAGYGGTPILLSTGELVPPLQIPILAITGTTNHGSSCASPGTAATTITYTITNTGAIAASGVTVNSSDTQFAVSNLSSTTINAGTTATYDVTFTPSGSGSQGATITVASTTTGSNSPTSLLTGFGDAPPTAATLPFPDNTQTICSDKTATVSGATASIGGIILWTHDGFGSISNATTLTPKYTPDPLDEGNTVILTMTVTSSCPSSSTAYYYVNVQDAAAVDAGVDQTVCSSSAIVTLGGTIGGSAYRGTWTGGTGTFVQDDVNSYVSATYTPSAAEIAAGGTVTLTLTTIDESFGSSSCYASVSDQMIVTINLAATANAGVDQTICAGSTVSLTGARSGTGVTSTWTSSGTGTFANAGNTSTIYTPTATDIAAGTVTLTITTNDPAGPCGSTSDFMVVTINPAATANAGPNQTVCAGGTITLAGIRDGGATSSTWSSDNGGTFNNASSLTSTYTPSIASGTVVLTLTTDDPFGPCPAVTSTMTVTVNPVPITTGVTICAGGSGSITSSSCASGGSASAGPNNAGTGVDNNAVGTVTWGTPGNITVSGTPYATMSVATSATTHYLQGTSYGFAIPASATINGIAVVINRSSSGTTSPFMQDSRVGLVKAVGGVQTTNKAVIGTNWPTTGLQTATYGGAADLWGTTWTPAEINALGFGVVLSAVNASTAFARTATVDYMQITVTYTVNGLNWYTVSSGGSSIGSGSPFNPVGVVGSGLANTNSAGTTTFYAECSAVPGCRTATNFVINPLPIMTCPTYAAVCTDTPSFSLAGGSPVIGTYSGTGVSSNTFYPATAGVGTHTITYSYTDDNECSNTCTFTITVKPAVVISGCPGPIVTVNTGPGNPNCSQIATWGSITADSCFPVTLVSSHNSGDTFPVGNTTVTYTFTNDKGSSATCTFTVTVIDNTLPVVNTQNITIPLNAAGSASITASQVNNGSYDNCGNPLVLSVSPNTFSCANVGPNTVTLTVTDTHGNVNTGTATVTVQDVTVPVFLFSSIPVSKTYYLASNSCTALVGWKAPTATDVCGVASLVSDDATYNDLGITLLDKGVHTITYTATDVNGNSSTASFIITVIDNIAPTITNSPASMAVSCASGACGSRVTYLQPIVSDNCTGSSLSIDNPAYVSGNIFPVGTSTINYTATDAVGNTATCSFTVTVTDTEKPVFSYCPSNITVSNDLGNCSAVVTWTTPSATDNCTAPGSLVWVKSHLSGSTFPVGATTVTYTATDAAGNTATCSFTVTVNDTEKPVFSYCPSNITTSNGLGNCSAVVTWTAPSATDNCTAPGSLVWTNSHSSGGTFPVGTTTVTYTAKDAAGNIVICSFTVTVNDTQNPVFSGCPSNIAKSNDLNKCSAVVTWTAPLATDNCTAPGSLVWTNSHSSGDTFPVGVTTVTYTAKDLAGNIATCSFTVTITDTQAPVILAQFLDKTCLWPPDHKLVDVYIVNKATDNCAVTCEVACVSNEPNVLGDGNTEQDVYTNVGGDPYHLQLRAERSGLNADIGRIYTITYKVKDASGNTAIQTNEVTVAHNISSPVCGKAFPINTSIALGGTFWDVAGNKHTAKWLVDGSSVNATVSAEPSGSKVGKVSGTYKPTTAGVYKLRMNITDQKGVTSYATNNGDYEAYFVAYDASGGYTYGAGTFVSPAGALVAKPSLTDKVTFGFTSNYIKGATNPKGETQFDFKINDSNYSFGFNALNYDYMVVSGSKVQYKGLGKTSINGVEQSGIAFILTVIDGKNQTYPNGVDKIRMKIYNKTTGAVLYDSQLGVSETADPTTVVYAPKADGTDIVVMSPTTTTTVTTTAKTDVKTDVVVKELVKVIEPVLFNVIAYPNPTDSEFTIIIEGGSSEKVEVDVFDMQGRGIKHFESVDNQPILFGEQLPAGTYIAIVNQGANRKTLQLIKK